VGESLLATLAGAAGRDWTNDLAASWEEAYGAIVGMMLAGYPAGESSASGSRQ